MSPAGVAKRLGSRSAVGAALTLWLAAIGPDLAWAQDGAALKDRLSGLGVVPSLQYQGAGVADAAGGARRGGTYIGLLQLQLLFEGGPLIGVPGLSVDVSGFDIHGGQPSGFVGDAQGVSNLAGPPGFAPYEAWLQYNTSDRRLSALAGLYDLSTEFDVLQSASVLLNGSFGTGPEFAFSGIGGPSIYPATAVGGRLAFRPAPSVLVQAGVFDGAPLRRPDGGWGAFESKDGLLLVSELAYFRDLRPEPASGESMAPIGRGRVPALYDTKIALGGWYYTSRFDDLSAVDANGQPVRRRGSHGAYLIAEQMLITPTEDAPATLAGFVQLGIADPRVNRFGSYVGAGLVATDLVRLRMGDQLAFGVAMARNGAHYMNAQRDQDIPTRRSEIALELSYLAPVTGWLKLQPDVQYVIHPNTDPALGNALVFQLQLTVQF